MGQKVGQRAQRRVQRKRLPDDQVRDQVISQDKRRRSGSPAGKDEKKAAQGRTRARVADEIFPRILREPGPRWAVRRGHEGMLMNRPPVRILKGRLMHSAGGGSR